MFHPKIAAKAAFTLAVLLASGGGMVAVAETLPSTKPVLQVDVPQPTADKPQSKIWFAAASWWALLPTKEGPSLWQRTGAGWHEHGGVRRALTGKPGRMDVWCDAETATAVGVEGRTIAVVQVRPGIRSNADSTAETLASWQAQSEAPIETITITRDGRGEWWVAAGVTRAASGPIKGPAARYGASRAVIVWHSRDARTWTELPPLATGISGDDICLVTRVGDGVGVVWSDQARDEVAFRRHRDGGPAGSWESVELVARGGQTADDHLNATLTSDGRLWLATKNSVDAMGQPQLVLRVREPAGTWRNFPYATKTRQAEPSRPIVVNCGKAGGLVLAHTIYAGGDASRGTITAGWLDAAAPGTEPPMTAIIVPDPTLTSRINDVTGPKAGFPNDAPWIVLASDAQGRVYEADVRGLRR